MCGSWPINICYRKVLNKTQGSVGTVAEVIAEKIIVKMGMIFYAIKIKIVLQVVIWRDT